ncbi:MAG TPA: HAMP domain-containing sensor histidine kinase [Streptosporangiaceae bacterium]
MLADRAAFRLNPRAAQSPEGQCGPPDLARPGSGGPGPGSGSGGRRSRRGAGSQPPRRNWRTLETARGRILGWSILLLMAAAVTSTVATHAFLVAAMNSRISAELAHEIAEFRVLAARNGAVSSGSPDSHDETSGQSPVPGATVLGLLRTRTKNAVLERDTVLIGLVGSRIVATSANFQASRGPAPATLARWSAITGPVAGTVQMAAGPARFEAVPVRLAGSPARGVFVAAVLTGQQQAGVNKITNLQLEVGAIALLIGSMLAWLMAGRVLRPVRDTTELARRITETDLSERIPARGHNEVSELAVTFNRMLDRLEAAMAAQRNFLADAGHELRTPITVIQGNLDTLNVVDQEDAETLAIVADEISRMSRLVDELWLLASSERPDFLHTEPTDLSALTRSLAAKVRALDDRPWDLVGSAAGVAMLDPQRVTQAVMQLAANAAAHTPAGSAVEIGSAVRGGSVVFTVSDHGPGVPAQAREQVFARFARLDSRRAEGTGLGLSIVAAIASAHGGLARIDDRDYGQSGAVFSLILPLQRMAAGGDQPVLRAPNDGKRVPA